MKGVMEWCFVLMTVTFCCLSELGGNSVAGESSFDDNSSFEAEPYYPMLRRHWTKLRQINPASRSLISVPVPRAGKRASEMPAMPVPEDYQDWTDLEREAESQRYKKFWPKYWTTFARSPIYWPGSQRPYRRY